MTEENISKYGSGIGSRKGLLTSLTAKLKVITTECKKAKQCPHCGFPVGKMKKKPAEACKIIYMEPRDDSDNDGFNLLSKGHTLQANLEEQKKISRELIGDMEKSQWIEYTPLRAMNIFQNMRKSDCSMFLMDTNHQRPEDLLVTHVSAPLKCIRPTVKVGGDRTNEDDATIKLYEMIRNNEY